MTFTFDLMFHEPSEAGFPGPSSAQIFVKSNTTDKSGRIYVSSVCVNLREVEEEINRLNKELDEIKIKARQKFPSPKKK
jgi:hypothetical protein